MFPILGRGLFARLTVLVLFAISAFAYASDTALHPAPSYNSFVPPAAGASYTDPVFGTAVKRVTDALKTTNADRGGMLTWITPEYSTANAFSQDNSHLILLHSSYYGLYDGQGSFLRNLPLEVNSSSEPRWSRYAPSVLYYHSGNQLKSYDVNSGAISVVHAFVEYNSISGKGESDISPDGDHMVFAANNGDVFVYTISTNSKGPVFSTGGRSFDSIYIAANNNVTITWLSAGLGRYQGIEQFDTNMNFVRQLTHVGGHMHMSQDLNADPVLIWTNSNDPQPQCGQNAIVKISLSSGTQTCLVSLDWNLAVHISAADSTWAFVETYAPSNPDPSSSGWKTYTNEILQIKLDGSEVRRLVHHRSRPFDSYNYQPKTTVSRDASRLVFGSNMDQQAIASLPTLYSDTYMVMLGGAAPAPAPPPPPPPSGSMPPATMGGIVNGASYAALGGSPAEIGAIFGTNLATGTATAQAMPLPTNLLGTSVTVNGITAPLYYVSPTQVNFQWPMNMAGTGQAAVVVTVNGAPSAAQNMAIAPATPGLFAMNQQGNGQGAILIANSATLAAPAGATGNARPANRNEYVSIYCTGLGAVSNPPANGAAASSTPLSATLNVPAVTIGGVAATVTFSGLAPGYVGLYQVDVQVPAGAPSGSAVPVVLQIAGQTSNTVTLAVQ